LLSASNATVLPAAPRVASPRSGGAPAGGTARTVTVRLGDSLEGIAKIALGDGDKWVTIYRANRSQIRDPRWIYPGQVLILPR
jgi:nucleoid-associated protein YgaU